MIYIILILFLWVLPSYLAIRAMYKKLDESSTVKDLFNSCYGLGWMSLIPFVGYVIWVEYLPDLKTPDFIVNFLNKKIK